MAVDSISRAKKPEATPQPPAPPPPPPPAPPVDKFVAPLPPAPGGANISGGGLVSGTEPAGDTPTLPSFRAGLVGVLGNPSLLTVSTERARSAPPPRPPEVPTGDPAADAAAVEAYARHDPNEGARIYREYVTHYPPAEQTEFVANSQQTLQLLGEAAKNPCRPTEERESISTHVASTLRDLPPEQRAQVAAAFLPSSGDPAVDGAAFVAAAKESPIQGAVAFELYLAQLPPEGRAAMVADPAVRAALRGLADQASGDELRGEPMTAEQRRAIIAPIARATDDNQGPLVLQIASAFVPGESRIPGQRLANTDPGLLGFIGALEDVVADGNGAQLGIALAETYKPWSAEVSSKLLGATTAGMQTMAERFGEVADQVDELNAELYEQLAAIGPGLTDAQREAFIASFKNDPKHKAVYAQFEAAGRGYVRTSDDLAWLKDRFPGAEKTLNAVNAQLPRASNTEAGRAYFERQCEAVAKGEPNVFSTLTSELKNNHDFIDKLSDGYMNALGSFLAGKEKLEEGWKSSFVVQGWLRNLELFGLRTEDGVRFLELAEEVARVPNQGRIGEIGREMAEITGRMRVPSGEKLRGAEAALKGTGMLVSLAAVGAGVASLPQLSTTEKFKLLADGMNAAGDTYSFIAQATGRFGAAAPLFKTLGAAGIGLGAVLDGMAALESFQNGDAWKGTAYGASAMGGALLALGAVATVGAAPLVAVGGLLYAGGIVLHGYADWRADKTQREENYARLVQIGVPPQDARVLADADPSFLEGMGKTGMNWAQVRTVAAKYPGYPGTFMENLQTFQREAGLSADQLFELMNWTSTSTRDLDVLGQLAGASFDENWSREDWIAYLRQAVKMPGFSDTGMRGRVLQYLENPPVRDY